MTTAATSRTLGARGTAAGRANASRRALEWLAGTFDGVTWSSTAVMLLLLFVYALGRPSVRLALVSGEGYLAAAAASLTLTFCLFVPMVLFVVGAINRGPAHGVRKALVVIAAAVVGDAIGATIDAFLLPIVAPFGYMAQAIDLDAPPLDQAIHWAGIALSDIAIAAMVVACWYWFKRNADAAAALQEAERAREQTRQETAEAQLAMMQAQIEPHFLFNTLASVRRLYETDATAGRSMLRHLAQYLAASLAQLRASESTLAGEIALAKAYLYVQKTRMGQRLTASFDIPESLLAISMPPMIVPTLVENAIIHGIGPLPEGGTIAITARAAHDRMILEVRDTGRGLREGWGAGIGLANVSARLQSRFGSDAAVRLTDAHGRGTVATVEMPLSP